MALSEYTIKQVALGFIKSFYSHRPRAPMNPTLFGTDMRGEGGIVADGFLKFKTEEEEDFLATFEATAYEVRDEVYYKPRRDLIRWDSSALAFSFLAIFLALCHLEGWYPLLEYGFLLLSIYALSIFLAIFIGAYFIFPYFRRYRYIFAVEQFKQYHADEQWIAVGHDVFSSIEDRNFKELKRQCIRYGFGLVMVNENRKPRLIMAPARAQWFGEKRAQIQLVPFQQVTKRLPPINYEKWIDQLKKPLLKLFKPIQKENNYRWFSQSHPKQGFIMLTALLFMSLLLYREWQQWPIHFQGEEAYRTEMLNQIKENQPESRFYFVDAPVALFGDTTFKAYILPEEEEEFDDLADQPTVRDESIPIRIIYGEPGEDNIYYASCERLSIYDTTVYLIQDTLVPKIAEAEDRLDVYSNIGLHGTAVQANCFEQAYPGYLLFVEDVYEDSLSAAVMKDSLMVQFSAANLPTVLRLVAWKGR